jgi:hypothetical protein
MPFDYKDYMGSAGGFDYRTAAIHFMDLFNNFVSPISDPEVLLVTGNMGRSGAVTFASFDWSSEGVADQSIDGDASVNVLDAAGNVLSVTRFALDFRIGAEPVGAVEVDTVPFAFSLPFPAEAAQVEVVHDGVVLDRRNLRSGMLTTAIASIPDIGFVSKADQRRKALLNKVAAFERQFASGNTEEAEKKLTEDIRKHLEDWLVDDYMTTSPLEYSKAEALSVIDRILR